MVCFFLTGLLTLRISNEQYARIHVHVDNKDTRPLQLQVSDLNFGSWHIDPPPFCFPFKSAVHDESVMYG